MSASEGLETIWWLPRGTTNGIVILANPFDAPAVTRLTVTGLDGAVVSSKPVALGPKQTQILQLRELLNNDAALAGGVSLRTLDGKGDARLALFIFDDTTGFSQLNRVYRRGLSSVAKPVTLRAPLVALASPAAALRFPEGTRLEPKVFVRNATDRYLPVSIQFDWRGPTGTATIAVPQQSLAPSETKIIELTGTQAQPLPESAEWATVRVVYTGLVGDVIATTSSYDASGRYGLQSPFSTSTTYAWKGGKWKVDPLHETLITFGNGTGKPIEAEFLIYFPGKKYAMPLRHLDPNEQVTVNVGDLIRNQLPDRDGNVLPSDLRQGSYEVRQPDQPPSGGLFEGKLIVDKEYGHATYGCAACCASEYPIMDPSPFFGIMNVPQEQPVKIRDLCSSNMLDVTWWTWNWASSETGIIIADNPVLQPVGGGTAWVDSWLNYNEPSDYYWFCPDASGNPGTQAAVQQPTSASVVSTVSQGNANCPSGQSGWSRNVTMQLKDQYSNPIQRSGISLADLITISTSTNALGITGNQTGSATTNSSGQWPDTYFVCSSACPSSTGQSNALQTWTADDVGMSHSNSIVYKCTSITVDSQ